MRPDAPAILVALSPSAGYERQIMWGLHAHLLPSGAHWRLYAVDPDYNAGEPHLPDVAFAGAIGRLSGALGERVAKLGIPAVATTSAAGGGLPSVISDGRAIGAHAAEHLLERGLEHFAYVGLDLPYAQARGESFRARVAQAGGGRTCARFVGASRDRTPWVPAPLDAELTEWLRGLPKPVGVFCARDAVALHVMQICEHEGWGVPDQIAVLGADNDDLLCRLCRPPLSSILVPGEQIGLAAARLLDELLGGAAAPAEPVLIPDGGVAERGSTATMRLSDPSVAAAVRFIRENAHRPLRVDDVLAHVPSGRRTLERRFREALGRSMHDELQRRRVERARELLSYSDLPLKAVARQCGFGSTERFHHVFRRAAGETPLAFRKRTARDGVAVTPA